MLTGLLIKASRESAGLSQRDLERKMGWAHGYLSRLESDEFSPSARTLGGIADAMDCRLVVKFEPRV